MEDQIVAMDRISELPDFIIHHIMSYLSTLEVTQTCVLSKRWNHLQTSFPILDFDLIYFEEEDLETGMKKRSFRINIDKFIQFVDASLLRFCEAKVSMQKFRLSMEVFDVEGVASLLDRWIELAVANEVKELDLNVQTTETSNYRMYRMVEELDFNVRTYKDRMYTLPGTLFSAKFVTTLKLSGCNLEQSSAYTTIRRRFGNREERKKFCINIDKFIQFVDASLLRFCEAKVSMQKFRLSMSVFDVEGVASLLDKWIELSVANEVKELDLNVQTTDDRVHSLLGTMVEELDFNVRTNKDRMYTLPGTLFSAKFVTTLKLSGCNLEQSSAYTTIRFHSLKKLVLNAVHIDEQMVPKLISECPLLEDLFLCLCWHCKHISVSHAPKLKILTVDGSSLSFCDSDFIGDVESIEIVAPSLQQCTLIDVDGSSVIDMVGCADLKYFNLTGVDILVQEFHKLISKFPLLEKLILNCCVLESISLSSNRLKELQVLHCGRLSVIDIDVPSLLTFSYVFYGNPASSINVPNPCSWKVGFSPGCQRYGDLIWLDSIRNFLKFPYEIEELSISISIWDVVCL
ncbi:hypothetical protein LWI29_004144 [Acer saccharum]|uniref:F-box domain-containing protein n=1 Tax=Acer saccharum TaxID=4024 RepID=A0AA39T0V7_ACESA|nr:hypothetical protein LWI29_004144 [Acer saccharum]